MPYLGNVLRKKAISLIQKRYKGKDEDKERELSRLHCYKLSLVIVRIAFIAVISCFIVLTFKPRLHIAVNKGGFARLRNDDNSYHWTKKWI